MIKVNSNRMLTAAAVYFKDDKDPIFSCVLFILDRFVIIGTDPDDNEPIWYNIDLIDRITGVNYWTAPEQSKSRVPQVRTNNWW